MYISVLLAGASQNGFGAVLYGWELCFFLLLFFVLFSFFLFSNSCSSLYIVISPWFLFTHSNSVAVGFFTHGLEGMCFSHDGPWRWALYNCLDLELIGGVYGVRFAPLFGTGRDLARRYFGLFVSWWYLWVDYRRWMGSLLTDGLLKVRAENCWLGGHAL